jgi:hypothetical protein
VPQRKHGGERNTATDSTGSKKDEESIWPVETTDWKREQRCLTHSGDRKRRPVNKTSEWTEECRARLRKSAAIRAGKADEKQILMRRIAARKTLRPGWGLGHTGEQERSPKKSPRSGNQKKGKNEQHNKDIQKLIFSLKSTNFTWNTDAPSSLSVLIIEMKI